jgi:hypothetical protein
MNAYAVLSIGDLKRMLKQARKSPGVVSSVEYRKKVGAGNLDNSTAVFFAPVNIVHGEYQLGTLNLKELDTTVKGGVA